MFARISAVLRGALVTQKYLFSVEEDAKYVTMTHNTSLGTHGHIARLEWTYDVIGSDLIS